ncbi:Hypothetical predicted protein [Lecanosticta acicola]|uniref:Uncharacterized protein n=1 Tax=Lecanosticta acicola TaxID=111012 RepID=A0AAI8YUS2_9PEZI|nr:Hypothetical predicted protein [Lecanosticta acicola]
MSEDLFAAFGEEPVNGAATRTTQRHTASSWESGIQRSPLSGEGQPDPHSLRSAGTQSAVEEDDDDFGDFEDANDFETPPEDLSSEPKATPQKTESSEPRQNASSAAAFPPKAPKEAEQHTQSQDSKIGKHPFAGHMDFLFEAGDDEYDAGADDLENLANNPEAAMAYSKRLIAEQQAQFSKLTKSTAAAPSLRAQTAGHSRATSTASTHSSSHARIGSLGKASKLTKIPPKIQGKAVSHAPANPAPARNKLKKKSGYAPAKDPNVLFDADDPSEGDDDDEFGDFEGGPSISVASVSTVTQTKPTLQASMPDIDLLGLDQPTPKSLGQIGRTRSASMRAADQILGPPKLPPSNSPSGREGQLIDDDPWADFETAAPKPTQISITPAPVSIGAEEDDAWDDFKAADPSNMPAAGSSASTRYSVGKQAASPSKQASESLVPLTNIPPPALLLSIFPSIFSAAQDTLFVPMSRLEPSQRHELLSHHATHQFIRSYLDSAIALAHIIAGRKLRWKRDQILSQSMRIGPAAAGGKGGMKLAGVDKSEVAKEDREVLDVVRLWKGQVGKLRGAVTTASSTADGSVRFPSVPEISETMPVRALKSVEGGFVAPHACALCGLKREERVQKVDVDIEDSFDEWWVNGMDTHVTCRNWWEGNKGKLRSR